MSTQVLLVGRGLFQEGLARVLSSYADHVEIIGAAESWEVAKTQLDILHPDTLIADHQYADAIIADMDHFSLDDDKPTKALFIILDENKMIVYQRQQLVDITIDHLVEAL